MSKPTTLYEHRAPTITSRQAVREGAFTKVEPCEHGNTGRHIIEDTIKVYSRGPDWEWCDGKPEGEQDE